MADQSTEVSALTDLIKSLAGSVEKNNEFLQENIRTIRSLATREPVASPDSGVQEDDRAIPVNLKQSILSERNGQKTVVDVTVKFLKISEVDTKKQQFKAEVRVDARWREPGLTTVTEKVLEDIDYNDIWNPKLVVMNMDTKPSIDDKWYDFEFPDSGAPVVVFKRKIRGVFFENLELRKFPCDVQKLTVGIMTQHPATHVEIRLSELHPSKVFVNSFRDQDEWHLYRVIDSEVKHLQRDPFRSIENVNKSTEMESGSMSMVDMGPSRGLRQGKKKIYVSCYAARKVGFWFWNVITVLLLITCLTFTPYAAKPEQNTTRLGIMMSLLLTTIAKKLALGHMLPSISYLTYLDMYILGVLAFLGVQATQFAVASIWVKEGNIELIKDIDHYTMIFMATVLATFNVCALALVFFTAIRPRKALQKRDEQLVNKQRGAVRNGDKTATSGEREQLNPSESSVI